MAYVNCDRLYYSFIILNVELEILRVSDPYSWLEYEMKIDLVHLELGMVISILKNGSSFMLPTKFED